jgi:hypothetical protein
MNHPPSAWLVTKAALRVLSTLGPAERATIMHDPLSRRAWRTFRDALHTLDRQHDRRAAWLFDPPADTDTRQAHATPAHPMEPPDDPT